ncbi:MAG: hypothetical protein ACI4RM_06685 [Ruminococcus sp.]
MKKLVSAVSVILIIFASFITAFAAGINSNEQSVLTQMRTPANMNGNMVYVPSSYVNQAEAHFNTIDMTSAQAKEINSIISKGRSFLEGTGKSSFDKLSGSEKKTLANYASQAAAVLNLSAAAGSDVSQVKVIDQNGNVIIDDSGMVIKTTGAVNKDFAPLIIAGFAVVSGICSGLLIFSKKAKNS